MIKINPLTTTDKKNRINIRVNPWLIEEVK